MSRKDLDEWVLQIGGDFFRFSHDLGPSAPKLARQKEWTPRVDVLETLEHIVVRVELAGVRSGQFGVQYNAPKHSLLIRGYRLDENAEIGPPAAPHLLEIDYGEFAREVKLPEAGIDVGRSHAQLTHGMLTILVPKREDPSPTVIVERTFTVRRSK